MNINGDNPRGGTGKSITFWDESCCGFFEDSDGNLGKDLEQDYQEIYVRYYVMFPESFKWDSLTNDCPQHKLMHIQHYEAGNPMSYFSGYNGNVPLAVPGLKVWFDSGGTGHLYYYCCARGEIDYYMEHAPPEMGSDSKYLGTLEANRQEGGLFDGNWHCLEFYLKMNTHNSGDTFNADGLHKFWLDGELTMERDHIPYTGDGGEVDPRRGFRYVIVGGNNNNRWTTSSDINECEQWYAVDDVVISTEYIGPDYVIA